MDCSGVQSTAGNGAIHLYAPFLLRGERLDVSGHDFCALLGDSVRRNAV